MEDECEYPKTGSAQAELRSPLGFTSVPSVRHGLGTDPLNNSQKTPAAPRWNEQDLIGAGEGAEG